jgi:hypothetical protein
MLEEFIKYKDFKKNKYFKIYLMLMEKSIQRNLTYDSNLHELHHVLPESLGGTTMIPLTFREHYIAHELLTRFTSGKDKMKMCFALHTFFHFNVNRQLNFTSRMYQRHKSLYIEACKERLPNYKKEIFSFKNMNTGDIVIMTRNEFCDYSDLSRQEVYNLTSRLTNHKLSRKFHSKGWGILYHDIKTFSCDIQSPKPTVNKYSQVCEYCSKIISLGNYKRWHGINCKHNDP